MMNKRAIKSDFTPFVVPAVILGAIGYGYMWFKGISFSDIMGITKRNMETAVCSRELDYSENSTTHAVDNQILTTVVHPSNAYFLIGSGGKKVKSINEES